MAVIAQTRDAVRDFLNAAELTPDIEASSAYGTMAGLETLTGGRILVVPRAVVTELLTMDGQENDRQIGIDVAIQFKGADVAPGTLDPYLALAESIFEEISGLTLSNGAVCTDVEWPEGAFAPEHVETMSVFTCILAFTFTIEF